MVEIRKKLTATEVKYATGFEELDKALEELDRQKEKVLSLRHWIQVVKEDFPKISFNISGTCIYGTLVIDTKDEVAALLTELGKRGLHKTLDTDLHPGGMIHWLGVEKGVIILRLSISFSGVKCNIVADGFTQITKYKVVCEE